MKKLMLAMVIVLAFSSAAFALNYQSVAVTVSGTNTFIDGVPASSAQHNNTLKINGSGTGWTANAEFVVNAGGGTTGNQSNGTFTLNDLYLKLSDQPFTFEVWNWGEDGQGADIKTPMEFVFADNAPGSSWASRLTTTAGGNNTQLHIKNDAVRPDYYVFSSRVIGQNTVGAAYRSLFDQRNIADAWVTSDLGTVTVTGEVARVTAPAKDSKYNFGAKAVFDSDITLTGKIAGAKVAGGTDFAALGENYFEANAKQLYRGSYQTNEQKKPVATTLATEKKNTFDVRARAKNDAAIGDMWVIDNDFFDISAVSENDWMKNTGYAAGVNYVQDEWRKVKVNNVDTDVLVDTTTAYAQYTPSANATVYVKYILDNWDNANYVDQSRILVRGFYKVNDKLSLYPRVFVNGSSLNTLGSDGAAGGTTDVAYVKDNLVVGSYVNYKVTSGQLQAALWRVQNKDATLNDNVIQLGYKIAL